MTTRSTIAITAIAATALCGASAPLVAGAGSPAAAPVKTVVTTVTGPTVPIPTVGVPTVPIPTVGGPTVPPIGPTTTGASPVTTAGVATGTVVSDDTGRITVTVPATWTDVDTRPSTRDDGGRRPTISASPDLSQWTATWAVPGIYMTALPPTVDPATLLTAYNWSNACNEGPVTPYSDGRFAGSMQTWSSCGGGATSLTVVAVRAADNTYTLYTQIQLTSPNDPALGSILASMGAVPGANPGEVSTPAAPAGTPAPVPAALLTGVVSPGSTTVTDDTGALSVAVPATWTDLRSAPQTNDDFSRRPRLVAAPDTNLYFQEWDAPGLELWAFPYRPDPYTLLVNQGWAGDCDDAGVQALTVRGYQGLMQTWADCGGTGSRIISFAVSPADQSATVYLEIQLPTTDDSTLISALASFTYNPTATG